MEKTYGKQTNTLLNFIKGCGCIGVIFIHVKFPGLFGSIICKLSQFAVPIFFLTSGYYAYNDEGSASQTIMRRVVRIIRITVSACLLYMFFSILIHLKTHDISDWLCQFLDWKSWCKVIFLNDLDVIFAGHLWFLLSQIIAYFFLLLVDKKIPYCYVYKFLPILFLFRILIYTVTLSYDLSWHWRGNFISDGIPWMLFGNYLAYNREIIKKINNVQLLVLAAFGATFSVCWDLYNVRLDISEIGIVMWATSLFLLAIKNPSISIWKFMEKLGGGGGILVCLCHTYNNKCYC